MQIFAALVVAAVSGYLAIVIPTGHIEPCRALFADVTAGIPRPAADGPLAAALIATTEAGYFHQVAQAGPVACFAGLLERRAGLPVTSIQAAQAW